MRTMEWPPRISGGRAQMVSGGAELAQMLRLALLGDQSENPFLAASGLTRPEPTWQRPEDVRAHVQSVIARFTSERRLDAESVVVEPIAQGRMQIVVLYRDLETGLRDRLVLER